MQWLLRLVVPPGGTVLDPFAGSGTTGEAAYREGFAAVLVEREAEYCADIRQRMALAPESNIARKRAAAKDRPSVEDHGPLFGGEVIGGRGRRIYGKFADQVQRIGTTGMKW